jgi:hypothetical protein
MSTMAGPGQRLLGWSLKVCASAIGSRGVCLARVGSVMLCASEESCLKMRRVEGCMVQVYVAYEKGSFFQVCLAQNCPLQVHLIAKHRPLQVHPEKGGSFQELFQALRFTRMMRAPYDQCQLVCGLSTRSASSSTLPVAKGRSRLILTVPSSAGPTSSNHCLVVLASPTSAWHRFRTALCRLLSQQRPGWRNNKFKLGKPSRRIHRLHRSRRTPNHQLLAQL